MFEFVELKVKIYERILKLATHRSAAACLSTISFIEAVFFPIPPDLLLVPMALATKAKAWWFAFLTTFWSVLGGLTGYLIGLYLFDSIGRGVIEFYGFYDEFSLMSTWYEKYGIWIVLVSGFLPIPYKIFTIASGVFGMSVIPFLLGSIIGRATRFFAVAGICFWLGDRVYGILQKYSGRGVVVISILLVAVFVIWTTR